MMDWDDYIHVRIDKRIDIFISIRSKTTKFGNYNLGKNICRLFHVLAQFVYITSETTRLLSPELNVRIASWVPKQLKT